jgi:hypothetical protein
MSAVSSSVEAKYDDERLDRLFAVTEADLAQRDKFNGVMRHWAGLNHAFLVEAEQHPSYKSINDELKQIRDLCAQLLQLMRDRYVGLELWKAADDNPENDRPLVGFDKIAVAEDEIEKLMGWAREARSQTAKKKYGRQSAARLNEARQHAVNELGHIWMHFAGRRPTRRNQNPGRLELGRAVQPYGPFYSFVSLAMVPVFGRAGSTGIDGYIRKTCTQMAKTPPPEAPSFIHTT